MIVNLVQPQSLVSQRDLDSLSLRASINDICDRIERVEPQLQALVPEVERRARLISDAEALQLSFVDTDRLDEPPLFGTLVGGKDIFRVEGMPTRAGSALPPEVLAGEEAGCVTQLTDAGALILGKTVTAEFAYIEPGPTRNPHNLKHTPGGSSSGSAAAVAAGYCPLALGTQTIGSTIRPAAFCGIVGFKPSFGRIDRSGVLLVSPSLDHVGLFTADVASMALAASVLCDSWQPIVAANLPVLGVPVGPYLEQASAEGLSAFEAQVARLERAGYIVRHVPMFADIEELKTLHAELMGGEMAIEHRDWFARYSDLYRPKTKWLVEWGQTIPAARMAEARKRQETLRAELDAAMRREGVDVWISPAAPGPAPEGITTTGDPVMNYPWTFSGVPSIALPAGRAANGLPLGLQCAARFGADEQLMVWAAGLEAALRDQLTDQRIAE